VSTFERRGGGRVSVETVEVSAPSVATALSRRSDELSSEEERTVRLRRGVTVEQDAPLAKKASGEVLDELFLLELELRRRYEAHLAKQRSAKPRPSAQKDRIVRSLRKKK
jgi:hypothetical protein